MKVVVKLIFAVSAVLLFFSCKQISVNDILDAYNSAFSSDYGEEKTLGIKTEPSLIPAETYEGEQPYELTIQANKGYTKYKWTFTDSSNNSYDIDTGMSVLYINTALYEKGAYSLALDAEDVFGNKYTDTAVVNIF